MSWSVAPAIATLRAQVDEAAPDRNKVHDGTIGDLAHSKTKSEHNPNAQGVVRAWDCTHDPEGGVDCAVLAEDVIDELDRRGVEGYVIFRGRIRSTKVARGKWRWYTGANPHNAHMHVSVVTGWTSREKWSLPSLAEAVTTVIDPGVIAVDGDLGNQTRQRVAAILGLDQYTGREWWEAVQKWAGLTGASVDGVPGPQTWSAVARRLGSGAGKQDGIVRAWQAWCNDQTAAPMPVVVPGAARQDTAKPMPVIVPAAARQDVPPAPAWLLPKGHLIGPNPNRRITWHDGTGGDHIGRAHIRAWQEQMKTRGWSINVDGLWGNESTRVLRAFQTEKGLHVDGILGPESWRAAWTTPTT